MEKKIKLTLITTLFCSLNLIAAIFESSQFNAIEKYANKHTLVVLDIDNTIATTPQHLGSEAWVKYMLGKIMEKGFDLGDALDIVASMHFLIHSMIDMVPAEDTTAETIKRLQNAEINVIAITSRTPALAKRTIEQLNTIGVDLTKSSLCLQDMQLAVTRFALYSNGIIFCAGNNKGEILFQFLDKINYSPQKIVFVDDRLKHIQNSEKSVVERGIEFVGIHYSRLNKKYSNVDPQIFEQELKEFKAKIGWEELRYLDCPPQEAPF